MVMRHWMPASSSLRHGGEKMSCGRKRETDDVITEVDYVCPALASSIPICRRLLHRECRSRIPASPTGCEEPGTENGST